MKGHFMGAAEKRDASMPFWPEAMGRKMALSYTQVSEGQMDEWEASGTVRFFRGGRNGQRLALREELKKAVEALRGSASAADDWFD
ncbi:hypothetical protein [Sphingomonas abietis]|uniref:Uncharacterized protein n=1 Tax=Sphingomonas abietis TaxID=3012344 RepID=A0ABY7NR11_9SPHN|nr:hypothetical protein [Sphingomonas abietis]WBO23982.1 hypothetical protein PBT88_07685 [Sphingomonas abietis]